ncbi:MAG TPA: GntG family PLP-dependent aldolase [Longimicrobiaceae bacterium]|nr:GntG family PLP-dependent aldolase [Longimicrobiaceae bacterium]
MTSTAGVPVDLRSDTVTRPSAQMRRVIAEAEVGDAVLGDDPTVNALEAYAAELLGKERALFFPSGVQANTTALLCLAEPGTEAVIDSTGHMLNWEEGAVAQFGGVQFRAVFTPDGLLRPEDVAGAIQASPHLPRTTAVCLENTHNTAGGRILRLVRLQAIEQVARERGVRIHLDGARLPNAAAASGLPMSAYAAHADTVMVALSKGLGAPVGSILAGPAELMEKARRVRRRLGGGMRQAGLLAAAGLYALRNNLERLEEDHRRAHALAHGCATAPGVVAAKPQTNIVMLDLEDGPPTVAEVLAGLEARGVRMVQFGPRRIRAVTHMDVDDAGIARAVETFREVVAGLAA